MKRAGYSLFAILLIFVPMQVHPQSFDPRCQKGSLACLHAAVGYFESHSTEHENLAGLHLAYVGALARTGNFKDANAVLSRLEQPNDIFSAYLIIAAQQAENGLVSDARGSIEMAAREIAKIQHFGWQMELRAKLAGALLITGDSEAAAEFVKPVLEFIDTLETGWPKTNLIRQVTESGVLFEDQEVFKQRVADLESPFDSVDSPIEFAAFLARSGEFEPARSEIEQIEPVALRVRALVSLSSVFDELGEAALARDAIDSARQIAADCETAISCPFAMIGIAKGYAALGDRRAALEMSGGGLTLARNGLSRTSYSGFLVEMAYVASLLGAHGSAIEALEAALETAEGIEDNNIRTLPFITAAAAFIKINEARRSFEIFANAADRGTQGLVLIAIADNIL